MIKMVVRQSHGPSASLRGGQHREQAALLDFIRRLLEYLSFILILLTRCNFNHYLLILTRSSSNTITSFIPRLLPYTGFIWTNFLHLGFIRTKLLHLGFIENKLA